jgi:hypothetical protein
MAQKQQLGPSAGRLCVQWLNTFREIYSVTYQVHFAFDRLIIQTTCFCIEAGITLCSYGIQVGRLGFDAWQGQETFLYSTATRPALGLTQPPTQRVPGTLSSEVKRPGREVNHSPQSSTEVKNGGAIYALPSTFSWHNS